MNKCITFAELDRFLKALGFTFLRVPKSHLLYEHSPSGAVLVLRLFKSDDAIDLGTLTVVRRTLIDNGLIEPSRWEEFLRERSLAG